MDHRPAPETDSPLPTPLGAVRLYAAGPDDADDICDLINGLAEYERLAHESRPDPQALRAHLDPNARPRCEALIARTAEGEAIGFALFFHTYSTFLTNWGLYLEDLFVRPAFRGHGIGFALFRQLASIARSRGCARLEWAVLDWNEPARTFYERLGARPMQEWRTMRLSGDALERLANR